jgi:hypothetical protein
MDPIASNPAAPKTPVAAVFITHGNTLIRIESPEGHVHFLADERTGAVVRVPDDLEDGPHRAQTFKSPDGRLAALFRNFDACLTVVLIDKMHHIAHYDDNGNIVPPATDISPQFQFIALIRPLWKFIEDAETRQNLLTFLELPRTLGPKRFYTRSERYQDGIDSLVMSLPLRPGAKIHDTAAGPGAASLDLSMKMQANGIHFVFSDREFELQLVRHGNAVAVFDKDGQMVSTQDAERSEQETLKRLWQEGRGIPFDRTDWRVEEFMQRHPQSMSRRTIDLMRDSMPPDEFDLVRNMNMIQYLTTTEDQKQLLRRLGNTVKDGGWLIVGKSSNGRIHHGLWRRRGDRFVLLADKSSGKPTDDGDADTFTMTVLDMDFGLVSVDAETELRGSQRDLVEVTM